MAAFAELHSRLPRLAEAETRTITVVGDAALPDDTYGFAEAFCIDRDCDCRRAFINVHARSTGRVVATLGYGWESRRFYRKWFGSEAPEVDALVGVGLPPMTIQSELSPHLARVFEDLVRDDPEYRERIKRHYEQFKATIDENPAHEEDLTVEECLKELEVLDLAPKMEWFQQRPSACDSAAALLDLHAPDLDPWDRPHARGLLKRLWELWLPDAQCLETRWERVCSLLREAESDKPRTEQEEAWRHWLTAVSDLVLDAEGRLSPAAVRALEEDDGAAGVIETLLCNAVPMLTQPLFEPALELLERVNASGLDGGRRFELVRAMALVHRGDVPAALKLFDRLARQEPKSLAVHLAAGQALLAAGRSDPRILRQAEWYLARARQRADSVRDWDRARLDAFLEALHVRR